MGYMASDRSQLPTAVAIQQRRGPHRAKEMLDHVTWCPAPVPPGPTAFSASAAPVAERGHYQRRFQLAIPSYMAAANEQAR